MCSRLLVLVGLLALLLVPSSGQAWTRAHVREAHARVELPGDEPARVQLELVVDVQGGWLERLELPGLDEDLTLSAEQPALITLESGEELPAAASAKGGTIVLKFARRDGLRRGLHRIRVRYETQLAGRAVVEGERAQLSWTLPGWEAGLLGADVTVVGPPGLRAVEDVNVAQDLQETSEGERHVLRFTRIHVPRASPWTVAWELPAASVAGASGMADGMARPVRDGRMGAVLALATTLLALLSRFGVRSRLRRQGLTARGALLGWSAPTWLLVLLGALAGLVWSRSVVLAMLCALVLHGLSCERVGQPQGPLPLGSFAPLGARDRAASLRSLWLARVGLPWRDVGSLLGALTMLALIVGAFLDQRAFDTAGDAWGYIALPTALSWLTSARIRLPRSVAEQVALLVREARRTRTVSCALSLVWYVAGQRREQPRLRLTPSARYPGLLRLELLVDSRRGASPLVLNVLTTSDSPAERWTRALWPSAYVERSSGSARTALMLPVHDLSPVLEELLEHFTRQSERVLGESSASRAA